MKFVPPLLVDINRLTRIGLSIGGKSSAVGMRYHVANVLRMYGAQDSEEVGSIRVPVLRIFILKIFHDFAVVEELGKDLFDTDLIIFWYRNKLGFTHLEKLLLTFKNLAQKVTIDSR